MSRQSLNNQNTDNNGAVLDEQRRYRYALWRIWDDSKPWVLFIGLNPSTADESSDDRTLSKCISYAKRWDYGGVYMANLFAYRTKDPSAMMQARDPIGKENDDWLKSLYNQAGLVIAAWGNDGNHLQRAECVKQQLGPMHCLKINVTGEPAHPLYQPNLATAVRYN